MSNISIIDQCISARRARSFNDRINIPFYIFAPDYRDSSGGIRVLHYLCHILNEMGEEAYIVNAKVSSPRLIAPLLTYTKYRNHFISGQTPAVIYPEVVSTNPLNVPFVVRWLLNIPGRLGPPIEFESKDLIYYYEKWCLPEHMEGHPLFIHPVDHEYFHNNNNPDDDHRDIECYYANKYFLSQNRVRDEHNALVSVGQEIKRSHAELASIFRRSKVLYCYEPSGIISEAQACGCPVLLVRSEYWPLDRTDTHHKIPGAAIYEEDGAYDRALHSLKHIPETHARARDNSWAMTKDLVEHVYECQSKLQASGKPLLNDAQRLWALSNNERRAALGRFDCIYSQSGLFAPDPGFLPRGGSCSSKLLTDYQAWLNHRNTILVQALPFLEKHRLGSAKEFGFHLIVRVDVAQLSLLIDTLESLNTQVHGNWRIDIFSTAPCMDDALNRLPQLGWHVPDASSSIKSTIDMLVLAHSLDCVVEISPGTRLDPFCLYRVADEAVSDNQTNRNFCAWFTDDDLTEPTGLRDAPRFKPAIDCEWIRCADLLGPVFVSAQAWHAAGGASTDATRPWYDLALRVVDTNGPQSIGHITEPLLSLPTSLPLEPYADKCMAAVRRSLTRRKRKGKVVKVSDSAWRIDYAGATPPVTIAIPCRDKPEYLVECVNLILTQTTYPDYEIVIVDGGSQEKETLALFERLQQRSEAPVRIARTEGHFNLANFANTAAAHAQGEFLLLLADDVRVLRADWINVLVRHGVREGIGCVGPILLKPPAGHVGHAGYVLGLGGFASSPQQGQAFADTPGYLETLSVQHSAAALSAACMLVRIDDLHSAGGLDATAEVANYADIDFCLRLGAHGKTHVVASELQLVRLGASSLEPLFNSAIEIAEIQLATLRAQEIMFERWFKHFASDQYCSRHLDRSNSTPKLEMRGIPSWHAAPYAGPRFMAFPVTSAQGLIRVTQPLMALRKAGKAHTCVFQWDAETREIPAVHDLARHAPDAIIAHQLLGPASVTSLHQWHTFLKNTFLVYQLDDLFTDMPGMSSLRGGVPADARSYLSRALRDCDRLVVSTDYLAEAYRDYITNIRVVPNRLERDVWLPLKSQRNTTNKPRVGWAGGTAHAGDLRFIVEVVAATAKEIDWVFMGMCPDEVRPYVKEFHPFTSYDEYPARLAALNLDLAVAPLEQIPFNRGKSNLRLLEYGALAIPVVCTDIDPYRNSPACRVANQPRAWVDALRERIHDPEAATREGDAMRQWVVDHYILEDHLDDWMRAHLPV